MTKRIVTVESIFEGIAPSSLFGGAHEYLMGIGIDPDVPKTDSSLDLKAAGIIRPVQYVQFSGGEIDSHPIAIITTPQTDLTWVVLYNGKVVAYEDSLLQADSFSVGQVAGNRAHGAWYYNNYIYISGTGATFDDVSRIGPLNTLPFDTQTVNFTLNTVVTGSTSGATATIVAQTDAGTTGTLTLNRISGMFLDNEVIVASDGGSATVNRTFASMISDNVWKGASLGSQLALGNAMYPRTQLNVPYLKHFGFAHTDGASYFLDYDVAKGLGYIHKIKTTRTTSQGDTNSGSAFGSVGALSLPFDFMPLTAVSYGTDIVIAASKTTDGLYSLPVFEDVWFMELGTRRHRRFGRSRRWS